MKERQKRDGGGEGKRIRENEGETRERGVGGKGSVW